MSCKRKRSVPRVENSVHQKRILRVCSKLHLCVSMYGCKRAPSQPSECLVGDRYIYLYIYIYFPPLFGFKRWLNMIYFCQRASPIKVLESFFFFFFKSQVWSQISLETLEGVGNSAGKKFCCQVHCAVWNITAALEILLSSGDSLVAM